jgi:hypothetical protein
MQSGETDKESRLAPERNADRPKSISQRLLAHLHYVALTIHKFALSARGKEGKGGNWS